MTVPSIPVLFVSHFHLSWPLDVELAILVGLYLGATRRSRRWPRRRTALFLGGIGCLVLATQSGIDAYDDDLLSVHMVQHLILLEITPLLLLLGEPVLLALRALPPAPRRTLGRRLVALRPYSTAPVCLIVFAVVVLGTHVPGFYDATVHHVALHDAEHALYVIAGLFLWWPLIGEDPLPSRRLGGFHQLVYVIVAMLPMTLIGAYLDRATALFYPAYAAPAHALGISAVLDQQTAGAIMWVGGSCIMVAVGLTSAMAAMVAEERRQQARDRYADRLASELAPAVALNADAEPLEEVLGP